MPTETTTRKKIYSCNGSQVTFPFPYPIHSESDIVVKVRTTATGAVNKLALTTDYTVTKTGANWDNGGNVVTVATYANTKTIMIMRVTEKTQTKDYVEGGNFPAESHEEGLDKLTRIVQELQEEVKRCLKMPDTDDEDLNMEIPSSVDRLSKWLGFDADGQPTGTQTVPESVVVSPFMETVLDDLTAGAGLTTLGFSAFIQTLLNDADAAAVLTTLGFSVFIQTLLNDADAETACDTIGALDVNNDTLDDVPEGTTYGKVLLASLSSNKINKIEPGVTFESAVTRYYAVPLTGFTSVTTVHTYGTMIEWTAIGNAWVPVALPDGAIITELYSYAVIADNNIVVELNRSALNSSTVDTMATHTHSGTGALTDTTISNGTVDNSGFNYHARCLRATHSATSEIDSIRIKYTITKPLP